MNIEGIAISHHEVVLDPPFPAAWDSQPRKSFIATLVKVTTDEGHVGVGSGDCMLGFEPYANLFLGKNPLDLDRHAEVLNNISFHAGRCWPLDIALWDLVGKIKNKPVYELLGNHSNRIRAYASTGVLRPASAMAEAASAFYEAGFKAMKMRFGRKTIQEDLKALEAVRAEVGNKMDIMVDVNQGWRMPWDTQAPWDLNKAITVAKELEAHDVYWMEEPLHRSDYHGMSTLRDSVSLNIAGGEMNRELYEFRELMERQCLDVLQPDAVLTGGITGLRKIALEAKANNLIFTPHTWGNGIGLLANAHLTAGTVGAPYLEFPIDPPEWTSSRRDFLLTQALEPDADGWIVLSDNPGLGIELDEDRLRQTLV